MLLAVRADRLRLIIPHRRADCLNITVITQPDLV
jgi:hypothetical protein